MNRDRVSVFLECLRGPIALPPYLKALERAALADRVPIIRPDTQSFLQTLLLIKKPVRILEVGCAVGFSALLMHETCPEAAIVTIEKDEERAAQAAASFFERGVLASEAEAGEICLLTGDADDILKNLAEAGEHFDLIFMDAAKGQYLTWLPLIKMLLGKDGVLLSDNVLREGDILESHYAVERRDRTIYKRMRAYLHALTHDDELQTTILSDGDGLAMTVKK